MAKFKFKLQPLLTMREHERDMCRQQLAEWIAQENAITQQIQQTWQERNEQQLQLKQLAESPDWSIPLVTSYRAYITHLAITAMELEQQRLEIAVLREQCQQLLVVADQNLKAIERLKDIEYDEFLQNREKIESREREESWQAGVLVEKRT